MQLSKQIHLIKSVMCQKKSNQVGQRYVTKLSLKRFNTDAFLGLNSNPSTLVKIEETLIISSDCTRDLNLIIESGYYPYS